MFDIIKYAKNNISSRYYKVKALLSVLDKIDITINNDNIIMAIDGNMVINQKGNMMIFSKDGCLVTSHKKTHINPEIKITMGNPDKTIYDAEIKEQLVYKQDLFIKLLRQKRIYTV